MYEGRLGARGELALVTAMRTAGRGRADRGHHRGNRHAGAAGAGQSLLNGVAAAAAAAMTVIASLTLLPTLLSFSGVRLNSFLGGKVSVSMLH